MICSATSIRQAQAIADSVEERLRPEKVKGRVEGYQDGEWILMDFTDFLVHVFTQSKREYFDLERLWGDAPRLSLPGMDEPVRRRRRQASPEGG